MEDQPPCDTIISCADGKVAAHRIVLVAASPFFKYLLRHHVSSKSILNLMCNYQCMVWFVITEDGGIGNYCHP